MTNSCKNCNEKFSSLYFLKQHYKKEKTCAKIWHDNGNYECATCKMKFGDATTRNAHRNESEKCKK